MVTERSMAVDLPIAERVAPTGRATTERRQELSRRAKRLNEKGKFGGAQPGSGRPAKLRTKLAVALSNDIAAMGVPHLQLTLQIVRAVAAVPEDDVLSLLKGVKRLAAPVAAPPDPYGKKDP